MDKNCHECLLFQGSSFWFLPHWSRTILVESLYQHFLAGEIFFLQAGGGSGFNCIILLLLVDPSLFPHSTFSWSWDLHCSGCAKKVAIWFITCVRSCQYTLPSVVVGLRSCPVFRCPSSNTDFRSFQGPWPWPSLTCHRMTRNIESSLQHVHHTQREAGRSGLVSLRNFVIHVVLQKLFQVLSLGRFSLRRTLGKLLPAADLYSGRSIGSSLDWIKLEYLWCDQSISIFRQAETLARPYTGRSTVKELFELDRESQYFCRRSLMLYLWSLTLGTFKLGSYLHKKLTS